MRSSFCGIILLYVLCVGGCSDSDNGNSNNASASPDITVSNLHALADFPVGVAVPAGSGSNSLLISQARQNIVNNHFNALTAENIMKPATLHPIEDTYFYDDADALINYANANGMSVHGHTLLWHQAVPDWMENYVGDSDDWIAMMESHISNVAAHFTGDVVSWDVVNEAFNDDGSYRQSFWYDNIGAEYIERAFIAARAADPDVDLYYNDYSLSGIETKLNAVLVMADDFLNRGIPIDGIGFQMHISLTWPDINRIRASLAAAADLGLKVKISELDIAVNSAGTFTVLSDQLAMQQAERYRQVVEAYIDNVPVPLRGGITVWGITDADSWIPWFYSRPDWPLLFDANFQPKPALQGFADGLMGD